MTPSDDDTDIGLNEVPSIRPDRDDRVVADGPGGDAEPPEAGDGFLVRVLALLALLAAVGAGGWAFVLQQRVAAMQVSLEGSQSRIEELERRLSSTDDNWSQSSLEITVKLKELVKKTDTLWKEMDKLWASAWRRNQKEIGGHSEQLKEHAAQLEKQAEAVSQFRTRLKEQQLSLAAMRAQLEEAVQLVERVRRLEKSAVERQDLLQETADTLNSLQTKTAALDRRVSANEEWVESINAHRGQVNQSLDTLRRSVNDLLREQSGAGATDTTLR